MLKCHKLWHLTVVHVYTISTKSCALEGNICILLTKKYLDSNGSTAINSVSLWAWGRPSLKAQYPPLSHVGRKMPTSWGDGEKLNKIMSMKCRGQSSLEHPFREVSGNTAELCLSKVRISLHGDRKGSFLSSLQSFCWMQSYDLGLKVVVCFLVLSKKIENTTVIFFNMIHNSRQKRHDQVAPSKRKTHSFNPSVI